MSEATTGTPKPGRRQRPADRRDERWSGRRRRARSRIAGRRPGCRRTSRDRRSAAVGAAAEVDLVLALAGDHELGVDPGVEHPPRGVQERREARGRDQRPGRTNDRAPAPRRDRGPLLADLDPGITTEISPGTPRSATRSSASSRLAATRPRHQRRLSRAGRRGQELLDRQDVWDSPVLGDRQAHGATTRAGRESGRGLQPLAEAEPADAKPRWSGAPARGTPRPDNPGPRRPPERQSTCADTRAAPTGRGTGRERPAVIVRAQTSPARSRTLRARSSIASPLALCDIQIRSRFDGPQPITSPRSRAAESSQCRRDSPAGNPSM